MVPWTCPDGGFVYVSTPRNNGCEKGALFTPQMYERTEQAALYAEIDAIKAQGRPFVFVDIGANVGLFSFLVASRAGKNANIIAIEPESENLRRLRFNITCNNVPIKVEPVAIADKTGHVAIELDKRDRGGTRITAGADNSGTVQCHTLLDVIKRHGITNIDALKIDIEGAEDRALIPFFKNAPRALWPRLLIIEDTRHLWSKDLFSYLENTGYVVTARSKLNVILRKENA